MLKSITKVGNSQGQIFDTALCELTGLKTGDQVNVTVHDGGAVVIMPIRSAVSANDAASIAKDLIQRNAELFKRLA